MAPVLVFGCMEMRILVTFLIIPISVVAVVAVLFCSLWRVLLFVEIDEMYLFSYNWDLHIIN